MQIKNGTYTIETIAKHGKTKNEFRTSCNEKGYEVRYSGKEQKFYVQKKGMA